MTASTFGVDAEGVRRHFFPHFESWSATTSPTLAVVTEAVEEEAAVLSGHLTLELIDASSITPGSAAYLACRQQLRLMVALRVLGAMTGADPALGQTWRGVIKDWWKALDEGGATFLGDGATTSGTSDPDGPTTHINTYGLTTDTAANMSTVVPRLRRDDAL